MSAECNEMVRVNWENQGTAVISLMDTLFRTQTLVDCTLSGTESTYKVHKVLLSSCSPYFQKIIVDSPPDCHPVFVLDASDDDLQALVQYLYQGFTDIPKDRVKRFLKVAMPVQCQGFVDNTSQSNKKARPSNKPTQQTPVNKNESVADPLRRRAGEEVEENTDQSAAELCSESSNETVNNGDDLNLSPNKDVGIQKRKKMKRAPYKKRKILPHQTMLVPAKRKPVLSLSEQSALDFFQPALDCLRQDVGHPTHDSFTNDHDDLLLLEGDTTITRSGSNEKSDPSDNSDVQTRIHPDPMRTVDKSFESDNNIVPLEEPCTSGDEPSTFKLDDDDVVIIEKKNEVFVIDDEDSQHEILGSSNDMTDLDEKEDSEKLTEEEMVMEVENMSRKKNVLEQIQTDRLVTKKQEKVFSELDNFIQTLPDGRYRCMFCPFIRSSTPVIKAHIFKNHSGVRSKVSIPPKVNLIKAFVCRQCNERFHTHERYREHTTLKHGEKPVYDFNLKCSYCGIQLENLTQYRQHAREVHNKNTQIVSLFCGLCGEKTNNSPFHTKTVCSLMRAGKMPHKVIIKNDADLKSAIMCDKCLRVFKSWTPFREHFMRGCGGP